MWKYRPMTAPDEATRLDVVQAYGCEWHVIRGPEQSAVIEAAQACLSGHPPKDAKHVKQGAGRQVWRLASVAGPLYAKCFDRPRGLAR